MDGSLDRGLDAEQGSLTGSQGTSPGVEGSSVAPPPIAAGVDAGRSTRSPTPAPGEPSRDRRGASRELDGPALTSTPRRRGPSARTVKVEELEERRHFTPQERQLLLDTWMRSSLTP